MGGRAMDRAKPGVRSRAETDAGDLARESAATAARVSWERQK